MRNLKLKPVVAGLVAFAALFTLYLGILTAVSGWAFTLDQLATYWYYIVALAAGFGLQIGLYTRLKQVVAGAGADRAVVATSGTTSGAAMVSCCAHYLTNLLPVVGASGLVALVSQYQVQLFWFGLAASAAGTAFVATRLAQAARAHAGCAVS
jgi:Cu+-exporting ATPase